VGTKKKALQEVLWDPWHRHSSLVIITLLAAFFSNFSDHPIIQNAFAGIRACVCVLIINSVIKLWKTAVIDRTAIVIFVVVFLLSVFVGISAVFLVLGAGVVGIAVSFLRKEAEK
jgi:chromate transporter